MPAAMAKTVTTKGSRRPGPTRSLRAAGWNRGTAACPPSFIRSRNCGPIPKGTRIGSPCNPSSSLSFLNSSQAFFRSGSSSWKRSNQSEISRGPSLGWRSRPQKRMTICCRELIGLLLRRASIRSEASPLVMPGFTVPPRLFKKPRCASVTTLSRHDTARSTGWRISISARIRVRSWRVIFGAGFAAVSALLRASFESARFVTGSTRSIAR